MMERPATLDGCQYLHRLSVVDHANAPTRPKHRRGRMRRGESKGNESKAKEKCKRDVAVKKCLISIAKGSHSPSKHGSRLKCSEELFFVC